MKFTIKVYTTTEFETDIESDDVYDAVRMAKAEASHNPDVVEQRAEVVWCDAWPSAKNKAVGQANLFMED
jgi:hypothetical protein